MGVKLVPSDFLYSVYLRRYFEPKSSHFLLVGSYIFGQKTQGIVADGPRNPSGPVVGSGNVDLIEDDKFYHYNRL